MEKQLGDKDVRKLGETNTILELKNFVTSSSDFDAEVNGSRCKGMNRLMSKSIVKLEQHLNESWNSLLNPGEGDNSEEVSDGGDGWCFRLASPLKSKQEWICEDCSKPYTNAVSYMRHTKNEHDKVVKVNVPKVECLLPHAPGTRGLNRHPMDQIGTHLLSVSNYKYIL